MCEGVLVVLTVSGCIVERTDKKFLCLIIVDYFQEDTAMLQSVIKIDIT